MTHSLLKAILIAGFGLAAVPALAAPVLRAQVEVAGRVVTVGDMFDNSGNLAAQPLFLAPAPGTSGVVQLTDIRIAALKAGLGGFDDEGVANVRVSRLSTDIDAATLTGLMSADLKSRGVLTDGVIAQVSFDSQVQGLTAAAVADPVQLVSLRYAGDSGVFAARFTLAGIDAPLDVSGRIDLMVDAPQLAETLASGTILTAADIEMQKIPLKLAANGNIATMGQLIGKQLQRQSRAGMVLKVSDVADPQVIARNDLVTVYLHSGPLTLTIKGTALNAASLGQPVAVLNTASKRMVHGLARADGAVEIAVAPLSVAGL